MPSRFPGADFSPNLLKTTLWLALATIAGPLLGAAFHRTGTPGGAAPAAATAAAAGLLLADTARRALDHSHQALVLMIFTGIALLALWGRARPLTRDRVLRLVLLLPVTTAIGYLLVSTPDLLEDLVRMTF